MVLQGWGGGVGGGGLGRWGLGQWAQVALGALGIKLQCCQPSVKNTETSIISMGERDRSMMPNLVVEIPKPPRFKIKERIVCKIRIFFLQKTVRSKNIN